MNPTNLLIGILLVWWVSHLITAEHGPLGIFTRLRTRLGVSYDEYSNAVYKNEISRLVACLQCTSVWVGWLVAFALDYPQPIVMGIVLSAGAVLVERWFDVNS